MVKTNIFAPKCAICNKLIPNPMGRVKYCNSCSVKLRFKKYREKYVKAN